MTALAFSKDVGEKKNVKRSFKNGRLYWATLTSASSCGVRCRHLDRRRPRQ